MKRFLSVALMLAACSPSGLRVSHMPTSSLAIGGMTRALDAVRDLDDVRDVADLAGTLAVATDRGVLLFAPGAETPTRIIEGLPSPDVRALTVAGDGALLIGTSAGVVRLREQVLEPLGTPPVGELVALARASDANLYACGAGGLAIQRPEGWVAYGEPFACTGIWPAPEEHLWVGTTRGLLYLEGDVVREHGETAGLPAGYVRSVVPMGGGRALALVQSATDAWFVFFDGERWMTYTVTGLDRRPLALARLGADTILVTADHAFVIRAAARATEVPLRALSRGPRRPALSYRATTRHAQPTTTPLDRLALAPLAAVPPNTPDVPAPGFGIAHLAKVATAASYAKTLGDTVVIADRSRGLITLDARGVSAPRSSGSLLGGRDLQIASDPRGGVFTVDTLGRVGRWQDAGFVAVASPEGARPWSIFGNTRGLYLAATVPTDSSLIRLYRREGDTWSLLLERRLSSPATPNVVVEPTQDGSAVEPETLTPSVTVDALPFLAVADDETAWVALRVREDGEPRRRGVVQLSPQSDEVLHHHYGQPAGGAGALQLPDDVSNVDLAQSGFAWFSSVVGAVRLGNSQSVTFGEARGVRGEVVSDVLVGTGNRVWVAAAEGPGYYFRQSFEFRMPRAVRDARPLALALDPNGHVWGAGNTGLVRFDGNEWQVFGPDALPTTSFTDLEIDADGRLWVLAEDRVLILGPGRRIVN